MWRNVGEKLVNWCNLREIGKKGGVGGGGNTLIMFLIFKSKRSYFFTNFTWEVDCTLPQNSSKPSLDLLETSL